MCVVRSPRFPCHSREGISFCLSLRKPSQSFVRYLSSIFERAWPCNVVFLSGSALLRSTITNCSLKLLIEIQYTRTDPCNFLPLLLLTLLAPSAIYFCPKTLKMSDEDINPGAVGMKPSIALILNPNFLD